MKYNVPGVEILSSFDFLLGGMLSSGSLLVSSNFSLQIIAFFGQLFNFQLRGRFSNCNLHDSAIELGDFRLAALQFIGNLTVL